MSQPEADTENGSAPQSVRDRIALDIRNAMRARDTAALSTLRTLLGALDNATAVPMSAEHQPTVGASSDVARRDLSAEDVQQILREEHESRQGAAATYREFGRHNEARHLEREIELIGRYLKERR